MKRILHAGSGPIIIRSPHSEWVNIDICDSHKPDFVLDYTKDLVPTFGEKFFDLVYSCHSIEHVPFPGGLESALSQFYQVLRPGGVLRIVVPDLMKVATKYVANQDLRDIFVGPGKYHEGPDFPATRFMFWARGWEHTVLLDFKLLSHFLNKAGFRMVYQTEFNQSTFPELSGNDRFEVESMQVEAIR